MGGPIVLSAVRTQIGVIIRGMNRVLIDANIFPGPNLFPAGLCFIRPGACGLAYPEVAYQTAILLLREETCSGRVRRAHVSVLRR